VVEYSFKSPAFFGSKMNLRSSAVRLASEDWRRGMFPVRLFHPLLPPPAHFVPLITDLSCNSSDPLQLDACVAQL